VPGPDAAAEGLLAAEAVAETDGATDADGDEPGVLSLIVGGVVPAAPLELSEHAVRATAVRSSPRPPTTTRRADRVVGMDFLASAKPGAGSVGDNLTSVGSMSPRQPHRPGACPASVWVRRQV
jgi:hypothetical protein